MFGRLKTKLMHAIDRTVWKEEFIKRREYREGVCRYPDSIVGRQNFPGDHLNRRGILVIAAHPDDDVLGVATTLIRHSKSGDPITIVFTTNGAGGDWKRSVANQRAYAELRYSEACEGLALLHIPPSNVISLGFPDGGLHRYIQPLTADLLSLLKTIRPTRIYVHSIEGGHIDHDVTSFVVQFLCRQLALSEVYEWAEYNRESPLGTSQIHFPKDPFLNDPAYTRIQLTEDELCTKTKMLSKHQSQEDVIRAAPSRHSEVIRAANPVHSKQRLLHFGKLPHNRVSRTLFVFEQFSKNMQL
ncbi:PIG-L family deacetylase [Alicyclobacillus fastidiosus]|uniref:PIG-L family deacetylase n=1 Tax=Alicyclobacillus fastidiosus TaxID=392011 RepID=A0ABY6ZAI8_9BACL|nr:PIG-L family deacetylase [Alicyclobacillus fastidiosus]WAH39900.1 PIG-L family deacetylase [Alicyclobacillus fastidiosus]GMA61171.1 hypothetical protein GCM10025859_16110 [Alicyclobacillus fastidiosus]